MCVSIRLYKNAARLEREAEEKIINPPKDFAAWEHERLMNRRLAAGQ